MLNMDKLMERVNKLKESELAEYMEQANEQYSKEKPSKRNEIEEAFCEFKRRVRNAKMHAANEERGTSMKTDILQNKINADIRKKKELEKQLEERKAARDFLIKDMESQTMLSRVADLIEARENFLEKDTEFRSRLQEYAQKQHLWSELMKMCIENEANLIESTECDEYYLFLINYPDVHPISFSRNGTYEEIIKNAEDAIQILTSSLD